MVATNNESMQAALDWLDKHAHITNDADLPDAPKPLTAEEKAAQLAALKEKMAEKQAARAAEALETEKRRRQEARDMDQIKREMEVNEMKKLAEQRRLEKLDDMKRREEVKKQIEQDRLAKKEADEAYKRSLQGTADIAQDPAVQNAEIPVNTSVPLTASCIRIQIRLPKPDAPLKFTLPLDATFKNLCTELAKAAPSYASKPLLQTFPTQILNPNDKNLASQSLTELGLAPSASLQIK